MGPFQSQECGRANIRNMRGMRVSGTREVREPRMDEKEGGGGRAGARGSRLPLRRGDSESMKPRSSGRANNPGVSDSCCSPATLLNNALILCALTPPPACCGLTRADGPETGSPESLGEKKGGFAAARFILPISKVCRRQYRGTRCIRAPQLNLLRPLPLAPRLLHTSNTNQLRQY